MGDLDFPKTGKMAPAFTLVNQDNEKVFEGEHSYLIRKRGNAA